MKAEDLRTKSQDELKKVILDARKEQFNQRFQKANGTLENTAKMRSNRRLIARAKTLLNESEKGIKPTAAKAPAKKAPAKKAETKTAAKKTTTKKAPAKKAAAKKKEA